MDHTEGYAAEHLAEEGPRRQREGVTLRSVVIGLALVVFVNFWILYSLYLIRASWLQVTHFPMGLFVPFMLLALLINPILRAVRKGLSRSEVLVVAAMGLSGAAVPGFSLMTTLLGTISIPYYLATPENQWSTFFHIHIPDWIAPSDANGAMRMLFEGLPVEEDPIPWGVWAGPLAWWMALVGAFALASLCMMVILRRQWVHNERLTYPLAQIAADMAEGSTDGSFFPPVMRTWGFKVGFGLSTLIMTWNMMEHFYPGFPEIPLGIPSRWTSFAQGFPSLHTTINFYTIAFAYLANLEVLFSIWFFHFLGMWQVYIFGRLGISEISGPAAVHWQSFGAMCALVVWGVWTARGHLRNVFGKAWNASHGFSDADEILSYRTAVLGTAVCIAFIVAWFHAAGMGVLLAGALVLLLFVTYVGVARVVAQSGLLYVSTPMFAQSAILGAVGPAAIPSRDLTGLAFSMALRNDGRGLFMPALAHVAKIGDLIGRDRRRLGIAVGLGLIAAAMTSVGLTLYWGYTVGAYNFGSIALLRRTVPTFNSYVGMMTDPEPVKHGVFGYFGIGTAAMLALTFLRYRLPWWPLHPLGLAITWSGMTVHSVLSVFIAWSVKAILLKIGGVFLYRRSIPFFMGLMIGYALNVGLSFLLDVTYFHGQGHGVHAY